jgi:hypothetical protein
MNQTLMELPSIELSGKAAQRACRITRADFFDRYVC